MRRLSDALRPGDRVFVPALSGESMLLAAELADDPERAREVHFIGMQFPGISAADYLAAHPTARQTACAMSPTMRRALIEQRADLYPLDYPGVAHYLERMEPVELAYAQVSAPDERGYCSVGLCYDFLPLVWRQAKRRVAHINPALPCTRGAFFIHISELHGVVEAEAPLLTWMEKHAPDSVDERIAAHVSTLIREHDTLQLGIGTLSHALASALSGHRRLKLHTGMISEAMHDLWESGALDRESRITTGVALGSMDFYRFVGEHRQIWFTDVSHTHDVGAIGNISRFIAVNTASKVDLFGQVNAEHGCESSLVGAGGVPAFAQGALRSRGGRSLICVPSTTKHGSCSNIVPTLSGDVSCTVPRYLADCVITEHGIAELRGYSLEARAQALISIAAPEHRDALANAWVRIRQKL